jgi:hypothetical protein
VGGLEVVVIVAPFVRIRPATLQPQYGDAESPEAGDLLARRRLEELAR